MLTTSRHAVREDGLLEIWFTGARRETLASRRVAERCHLRLTPTLEYMTCSLVEAASVWATQGVPCGVVTPTNPGVWAETPGNSAAGIPRPVRSDLVDAKRALVTAGLVRPISRPGLATCLFPTEELTRMFTRYQVTDPVTGRLELRRSKRTEGEPIGYTPGPQQIEWVNNLADINHASSAHEWQVRPFIEGGELGDYRVLEPHAVQYNRVFNDSRWDRGGRFYSLSSNLRRVERATITVDGEPTVELDFSSYHPTIVYELIGRRAPRNIYTCRGVDADNRAAAKLALLIAFNADSVQLATAALEHGLHAKRIPLHGMTAAELIRRLTKHHNAVSHFLSSGVGLYLQFIDSMVAEQVLLECADAGIGCLSVHDSFVVPARYEADVRGIMTLAYREVMWRHTGHVPCNNPRIDLK